ncbi:MAG: hypothetical protein HRF43_07330 [Phycisphaerae bacterium]|jgi:hypothetical protein
MNSLVDGKIKDLLRNWLHYKDTDCGTVLEQINALARVAGHDLDERFANAGLGAGPEARVASRIVGRALLEQGDETPDYEIRTTLDMWLRRNRNKGR